MTVLRPLHPIDLAHHSTGPRPITVDHQVGDLVYVGKTRWIIRNIVDTTVELEASKLPSAIWWTTTLDRLPAKTTAVVPA